VKSGEAKLLGAHADIKPPDPLPRKDRSVPLRILGA
jgi:hypothetical protein